MRFPVRINTKMSFKTRLKNIPMLFLDIVDKLVYIATFGYIQPNFSMLYFIVYRDDNRWYKGMTRMDRVRHYYKIHG